MRIFKPYFVAVAVLWSLALVLAAIDLTGPTLGAAPLAATEPAATTTISTKITSGGGGSGSLALVTTIAASSVGAVPATPTPPRPRTQTPEPTIGVVVVRPYVTDNEPTPPPDPTPIGATVLPPDRAGAGSGGDAAIPAKRAGFNFNFGGEAGGGLLYPLTSRIPAGFARGYAWWHWFYYPLPVLASGWLFLHIRTLKRAQVARNEELAQSWVFAQVGPQVDDKTAWEQTEALVYDLYGMIGYLPHNTPKLRGQGNGVHLALGYVSRRGDGIRLTATLPQPKAPEAEAVAAREMDSQDKTARVRTRKK